MECLRRIHFLCLSLQHKQRDNRFPSDEEDTEKQAEGGQGHVQEAAYVYSVCIFGVYASAEQDRVVQRTDLGAAREEEEASADRKESKTNRFFLSVSLSVCLLPFSFYPPAVGGEVHVPWSSGR